jgi:hypothetical protein
VRLRIPGFCDVTLSSWVSGCLHSGTIIVLLVLEDDSNTII